jgi:pyroglutamyl-peptidase
LRTILITGFGRFPGAPVNPAGLVAARLVRRRRPALAGTRRVAHVFATRYDAVDRELPALLTQEKPDIVIMFGVATRARAVRVEQRALNRIARFPDAGGHRPAAPTIAPQRGALRNPLAVARLVKAARMAGVPAAPSRNAGTYLCNFLYWRALEAAGRTDGPSMVIFIHLPPVGLKELPKKPFKRCAMRFSKKRPSKPSDTRRTHKRRAPRLDDLVRAGEAIVLAMASLAAARAPTKRAKLATLIGSIPQTGTGADNRSDRPLK